MFAPVLYTNGPFAGQYIQASLSELQAPKLGRKYGIKDRRPIDPPPVARLRVFGAANRQHPMREINFGQIPGLIAEGYVCHVDLFPMPAALQVALDQNPQIGLDTILVTGIPSSVNSELVANVQCAGQLYGITAASIRTGDLAGSHHVQGMLLDYRNYRMLLFPFGDLSVKEEGYFCLRYRVCDVLSQAASHGSAPILAEGWGGVFKIWGSKEFPGLEESTDLSKLIAVHGNTPINVRQIRRMPGTSGRGV